jgi:hypothetical protein
MSDLLPAPGIQSLDDSIPSVLETEQAWKNKWECAVEMAALAQNERDRLAALLCRVQLPLPIGVISKLCTHFSKVHPGAKVEQRGSHLEIFDTTL